MTARERIKAIGSRVIKLGPIGPARYVIPLKPQTKDRTRGMVVKNKKTGALVSVQRKTTRNRAHEDLIQEFAMEQHPIVGAFNTRLSISIAYYCEEMRGDIDNLVKATLDGMNRGIFTDDCLIDELYARRVKCPPGLQAQSVVSIRPIEPNVVLPDEAFVGEHSCPMCGNSMALGEVPF